MTLETQGKIRLHQMPGPSLIADEDVTRFQHEIRALVADVPGVRLILDCSGTHHVSSRVLGILVAFHKEITAGEGRMVLFGVTPATARVLSVTRLDSVLTMAETEDDARLLVER